MSESKKEHFARVVTELRANGTLSPSAAAAAIDGYDTVIADIAKFEALKAEDERERDTLPPKLTRDGEVAPRTKGKSSE